MSVKYESPSKEVSTSSTQGRNLFSRKKKPQIGLNAINIKSARITLIPVFVLLFVFLALPMINSVKLSFSRWGGLGPLEPVGFDNYKFLFSDTQMRYSSRITIFYAFTVAFFVVAIGTLLAAAVSANVRGHKAMKLIWFFPGIAPPTAVAIFWSSGFQPESGVVNILLGKIGLGSDHAWLASSDTALLPVIFVGVWSAVGFAFLVILGAVEQIPVSLREAALVDGANMRQQFTKITLPLIRPILMTIFTLEIIWTFNGFTVVWAMTTGGPSDSTSILPILAYKEAFRYGRFGTAAAMAVITGIFLMVVGTIGIRLSRSEQQ
ncbi:MAG: sugar ABC transporter permease [Actinobacteria bacterium]|nr:sugar ABC transporter permease [Actinomycetota bacterium]